MASSERRAMPRKEGFRSIRSSSGSAFGAACEEPAAATGKEPRRCTGLSVEARSLVEVSCPGVFLPEKHAVFLGVYLLNQYLETDCFPSVFPIVIQRCVRFEKVFENAVDPGAVADLLESFLTRFELIQLVPPAWEELAYYEKNTRDFLFPEPTLTMPHPGMYREVLMKTAIGFPGIAPKLEFATRTAIRECVPLHRNRFLEQKYKSQRPLSLSRRPIFPLNNTNTKMVAKTNRLDKLPASVDPRVPSPYCMRRCFLQQPALFTPGNDCKISAGSKPPFVVDSAKPFGENNSEHCSRKSKRKSEFSNFPFPMRRASSLDSLAANVKVIKEPDERIILRRGSPSPLDSRKLGKLSLRNQGDTDCHREMSFATSQHSRTPSPQDQLLFRERFQPSSRPTWKKIHERVCRLLTSHRAQQHPYMEDPASEINYVPERPSSPWEKCPQREQRYF
ncbi:spermatogenesis associated 6-like protein isoform X2 [Ochotona princeps]|uniref:spermatogenesis associated 6-like protein isoform X2 n=1 Tax=Ochotona princeps TaxID=9978 RepID=UPI002714E2C5|nr:spermatogenesis associated 6-like protein isoform X2 [Ochotona princeps]